MTEKEHCFLYLQQKLTKQQTHTTNKVTEEQKSELWQGQDGRQPRELLREEVGWLEFPQQHACLPAAVCELVC